MKKFTLLLASALIGLPALADDASVKSVPYSSAMGDDSEWSIINVDPETITWEPTTLSSSDIKWTGSDKGLKYNYKKEYGADDWAISPAIALEAGKEYKIKFCSRVYYQDKLILYTAQDNSTESLKSGLKLYEFVTGSGWQQNIMTMTPETSGNYYFGFHGCSPANAYYIEIIGFEIEENVFVPGSITGLTFTPGENHALEADLSWTLPTTDADGVAMPEGVAIEKVNIYRDGILTKELAGDATSWKDTEEDGLTPGYHYYEVEVVANATPGAKVKTNTLYVGPIVAQALPWIPNITMMTQAEFDDFFTVLKGEDSETTAANNWKISGSSYSGYYIYFYAQNKKCDNWMITPPLKAEKAGVYKITVSEKFNDYTPSNTTLYVGSGNTIADFTNEIGTIHATGSYKDYDLYFYIDEPKEFNIAFREQQPGNAYTVNINKIEVVEWYESPLHVSDAKAVGGETTVALSWTNPAKSNIDGDISGNLDKIEIYRGEETEPIATLTDADNLTPGTEQTFTDTPGTTGVVAYRILPYWNNHVADGEAETIYSTWVGDPTQAMPYSCDFKDATKHCLWTAKDSDNDDTTWQLTTSGAVLNITRETASTISDVLETAPFDLNPGYYEVTSRVGGGISGFEIIASVIAEGADQAIASDNWILDGGTGTSEKKAYLKIETAGKYRFDFTASGNSSTEKKDVKIQNVAIAPIEVLPAVAKDLTVTPGENFALKATVTWTNPKTTNVPGVKPEIERAVISRKYGKDPFAEIATITEGLVIGEESSYTDETITEAGTYEYKVEIYSELGKSESNAPRSSAWIGGGHEFPHEFTSFNDWTAHNVNGDYDSDDEDITWISDYDTPVVTINSDKTGTNDWIISPRLNVREGDQFEISLVTNHGYGTTPYTWELYAGTSPEYSDMKTKIADVTTHNVNEEEAQKFIIKASDIATLADDAEPTESQITTVPTGILTVGFHAKGRIKNVTVKQFSITKNEATGISDVEVDLNSTFDLYDLDGIRILKDADRSALKTLTRGIYIIRQEGKSLKVRI